MSGSINPQLGQMYASALSNYQPVGDVIPAPSIRQKYWNMDTPTLSALVDSLQQISPNTLFGHDFDSANAELQRRLRPPPVR